MKRRTSFLMIILACALCAYAQSPRTGESSPKTKVTEKDVDPLALDVLRAVAQPVEQAHSFSFRALISEEEMASDDQIVTFFRSVDVTVQRPDKIRLILRGRGHLVDFYGGKGTVTMYAPDTKLYATIPSKDTIDASVAQLRTKGVDMPIGPFLRSDFYDLAVKSLVTGYVIGRVKLFDQDVHQLAFTAPDADWQLWVVGGKSPRFVRAEIVNKKLEGKPRTIIQFLDWNLSPAIGVDEFTFIKPPDAHEISMIPDTGGVK